MGSKNTPPAFHVIAKPIGPVCNLDCTYCFYLEKENLYSQKENFRMSDEVLELFILCGYQHRLPRLLPEM